MKICIGNFFKLVQFTLNWNVYSFSSQTFQNLEKIKQVACDEELLFACRLLNRIWLLQCTCTSFYTRPRVNFMRVWHAHIRTPYIEICIARVRSGLCTHTHCYRACIGIDIVNESHNASIHMRNVRYEYKVKREHFALSASRIGAGVHSKRNAIEKGMRDTTKNGKRTTATKHTQCMYHSKCCLLFALFIFHVEASEMHSFHPINLHCTPRK